MRYTLILLVGCSPPGSARVVRTFVDTGTPSGDTGTGSGTSQATDTGVEATGDTGAVSMPLSCTPWDGVSNRSDWVCTAGDHCHVPAAMLIWGEASVAGGNIVGGYYTVEFVNDKLSSSFAVSCSATFNFPTSYTGNPLASWSDPDHRWGEGLGLWQGSPATVGGTTTGTPPPDACILDDHWPAQQMFEYLLGHMGTWGIAIGPLNSEMSGDPSYPIIDAHLSVNDSGYFIQDDVSACPMAVHGVTLTNTNISDGDFTFGGVPNAGTPDILYYGLSN